MDPWSESAVALRKRLADLIWRGREDTQEFYDIRSKFSHLAPALATLCDRQVSEARDGYDANLIRSCVIASRFGGDNLNAREPVGKLREHFRVDAARREEAFWAELKFMDEVVPADDDRDRLYHAEHDGLVGSLTDADRFWLLETLADEGRPQHRAVARHALIDGWHQGGRVRSELDVIRSNLKGNEKLGRILEVRVAGIKRNRTNKKLREQERKHRRWQSAQGRQETQRLEDWEKWRDELLADPVAAFLPEKREATVAAIYLWLANYKQASNSWNVWDKDALTQAFSGDIANRTETAFRAAWRTTTPVLWAAQPAAGRNNMPRQWIYGFLGVSAEAMTPGWAASLSSDETRAAVAYATIELGGFAPFIADLAKSHPAEVSEVIAGEVSAEISVGGDHTYLPVLQGLARSDGNLKQLLRVRLLDELMSWPSNFTDETGPRWAQHLDHVLDILGEATSVGDREAIAQECIKRYEADPLGPLALVWLKGLFRFDALKGTQVLTEALGDSNDPSTRKRAVEIFAALFGGRDAIVLEIADPAQRARVLGQLVRLAYAFVRPRRGPSPRWGLFSRHP